MRWVLLLVGWVWTVSAAAQGSMPFYARPGGPRLGEAAPAALRLGTPQGSGREAVLDAWAPLAQLRRTGRADYPWRVGPGGAPLAARPGGPTIGRAEEGMVAREAERRKGWVRLQRRGWVPEAATPARNPNPGRPEAPAPAHRDLVLHAAPGGGDTVALLRRPGAARALERRGAWVRVQLEGWLPAGQAPATPSPTPAAASLRPSDVRARPDAYRGARVRWRVEVLGLERADSLRPDFRPGEAFLLVRRPEGDAGLVYLALPEALVPAAQRFAPLQRVLVIGRLRTGRARPTGHPLVDVDTLIF